MRVLPGFVRGRTYRRSHGPFVNRAQEERAERIARLRTRRVEAICARAQEPHRRSRSAGRARACLERHRTGRRRSVPRLRLGDPGEGRPSRRLPAAAGAARGGGSRHGMVLHRQRGGRRHQRVHVRRTHRPDGVRLPRAAPAAGGLAVPSSGDRQRQRSRRHRIRAADHLGRGHLPSRAAATRACRRHAVAQRIGRPVRLDGRRAPRAPRDADRRLRRARCVHRTEPVDHHQDPAEPHRPAPARAVRMDVRR